ncbi:hypothetical protein vseg_015706 [Gypsophila vaccaria]
MEKRLRSSLETSSDLFLELVTSLGPKASKATMKTLIQSVPACSPVSKSLPISLHSSILSSITSLKSPVSPSSPPSKKPRHRHSSRLPHNPARHKALLCNLQAYAFISLICAQHPRRAFPPEDLFPAVRELHDNLIIFETDSTLLTDVSRLCEEWWREEFFGRELLISHFLPFLVSRSLTLRKKVDLRRVYVLRDAFLLFDFEDDSIEDLKLLLIRCVITPLYLKTEDGRRFLAFLFGLSPQLLKEVLAMIKSQIPFGRKSMLEAYGDILFRGWKGVEGPLRTEIEDGFLQGLVEAAVLAASASFAASVRRVLGGFVSQRTVVGVEKLLFRLAEPLIFRSLQVANSNVRQNALHLLLDLFPLEDPDASKEAKDTLLQKEFFLLEKLLKDDCPEVRVVAVEGCCRILRLFWEIIPSSMITKILTLIFDDMSHDISSEVRLSTLNGVIYLMGNPQAHEVFKVLLPRLGTMISDPVLSIRIAVADLLLLIADIRGFQFIKVVNLDALLSTLANDQPAVAQKITQLLMPSYFPSKVNVSEACSRVLTLIKRSPLAGARFCEFAASEGESSKSLMELVRVLIDVVLSRDRPDADHIKGVFVALGHLCRNLVNESFCREALKELFSGEKLKRLLTAASLGDSQSALFDIVSIVSPAGASGLLEECLTVVKNCSGLPTNPERQSEVRSAHKLVLNCNWFDNMLEAVSLLLQDTALGCNNWFGIEIPREMIQSAKRKKTKLPKASRKVKPVDVNGASGFKDSYQISAGIAWQIKDLLASETGRKAIFKSKSLRIVVLALKIISEASVVHSLCCDFMDASLIDSYMALSLCMTLQDITVNDIDGCGSGDTETDSRLLPKETAMDETLHHLLSCTEALLNAGNLAKFGSLSSGCKLCRNRAAQLRGQEQSESHADVAGSGSDAEGAPFGYRRKLLNFVKICTTILKYIVDAATLNLTSDNQQRCLSFTSTYLQNMISVFKRCFNGEFKFQDAQLREIHVCLKSSFTYSAKLVNLVLAGASDDSPAPVEVYEVSNHLLDLIASTELHCGSNYAARLVTVAKLWLPDIILGLRSKCMLKQSSDDEMRVHPWLTILANLELHEMRRSTLGEEEDEEEKPEDEGKFPAFEKLVGMMVQLVKINDEILDGFSVVILLGSATGLHKKEFGLVLGLVRFVFAKLVTSHYTQLGKLNMTMAYVQELYPLVESCIVEADNGEGFEELVSIKELLEPVWLHSSETGDFK